MRIHLPLHPHHFVKPVAGAAGSSAGPLAEVGGELVVIELQGELTWEGEHANGVVGVLGLDRPVSVVGEAQAIRRVRLHIHITLHPPPILVCYRPPLPLMLDNFRSADTQDRPTLHVGSHHLLHGKIATLAKPYAVIRRAVASAGQTLEGDAEEEESDADNEEEERTPKRTAANGQAGASGSRPADPASSPLASATRRLAGGKGGDESEEEEDGPLFPEAQQTPPARSMALSSSPFLPPSSARDYSSDLDSSPVRGNLDLDSSPPRGLGDDDGEEEEREREREERKRRREEERAEREREERHRARRRAARPERTRHYEVVGVVRKKIVFALR